ncbi:hypothetical protein MTBPR1_100032 [Candidatus Terasakiella magnetica]|uniref:Lipoprotein n=1 Tax=Candidatus Terasakiella magnetica TaxID=1867952 RepID=A0A1C3RDT7_9PROT|nr:hypothetical protein [Candidatus Terasakiella magnetica]SCA55391.1 hypothetical protein MTBPR1_100032 [Candidatus Terasakiella magnetica]
MRKLTIALTVATLCSCSSYPDDNFSNHLREPVNAMSNELLCAKLAPFSDHPLLSFQANTKDQAAMDKYTHGFLELQNKRNIPDFQEAIRLLHRSFILLPKDYKSFPANILYPLLCVHGTQKETPKNHETNDIRRHEQNWLFSSDSEEITIATKAFGTNSSANDRTKYFLSLSYLLGRGTKCDILKAKNTLSSIKEPIRAISQLLREIEKLQTSNTHICQRDRYLAELTGDE